MGEPKDLTITAEDVAIVPTKDPLMSLVERAAFDPNFDPAKLQVLMEMKFKWDAEQARKAYIGAIKEFKSNKPLIEKTKHVSFPTSGGGKTEYNHAELDKICELIIAELLKVGITHKWRTSVGDQGKIRVTCVLTHSDGHSEDAATLDGPPDTSGGKNNIQAIGSTTTYLERYTLLAACGLAAKGTDNDGKTEGMEENGIVDYCIQMQDAMNFQELKPIFAECWEKAKKLDDRDAQERFRKVYEQRKKELNAGVK